VLLDLDGTLYVLGRFLARPDAPPTHVLVADPSYGATYDDLAADIGGGQAIGAATVLVRSGKGTAPSRAPRPSLTRSSTASPICQDCSNGERADRQP
jgi:HAD-hyrolase-like